MDAVGWNVVLFVTALVGWCLVLVLIVVLMWRQDREVCVCAAVRLDDGYVVRGHRHDDCILKAGAMGYYTTQEMQGFLTSRGRWVDREEGARLMREAGHYSAMTERRFDKDTLFSEDLY